MSIIKAIEQKKFLKLTGINNKIAVERLTALWY